MNISLCLILFLTNTNFTSYAYFNNDYSYYRNYLTYSIGDMNSLNIRYYMSKGSSFYLLQSNYTTNVYQVYDDFIKSIFIEVIPIKYLYSNITLKTSDLNYVINEKNDTASITYPYYKSKEMNISQKISTWYKFYNYTYFRQISFKNAGYPLDTTSFLSEQALTYYHSFNFFFYDDSLKILSYYETEQNITKDTTSISFVFSKNKNIILPLPLNYSLKIEPSISKSKDIVYEDTTNITATNVFMKFIGRGKNFYFYNLMQDQRRKGQTKGKGIYYENNTLKFFFQYTLFKIFTLRGLFKREKELSFPEDPYYFKITDNKYFASRLLNTKPVKNFYVSFYHILELERDSTPDPFNSKDKDAFKDSIFFQIKYINNRIYNYSAFSYKNIVNNYIEIFEEKNSFTQKAISLKDSINLSLNYISLSSSTMLIGTRNTYPLVIGNNYFTTNLDIKNGIKLPLKMSETEIILKNDFYNEWFEGKDTVYLKSLIIHTSILLNSFIYLSKAGDTVITINPSLEIFTRDSFYVKTLNFDVVYRKNRHYLNIRFNLKKEELNEKIVPSVYIYNSFNF